MASIISYQTTPTLILLFCHLLMHLYSKDSLPRILPCSKIYLLFIIAANVYDLKGIIIGRPYACCILLPSQIVAADGPFA